MDIHNTTEDIVFAELEKICDSYEKEGRSGICLCDQCRLDAACYVLNRTEPRYIVSNRGAARVDQENIAWQQKTADIAALIYDALKRVNRHQRSLPDNEENEIKFQTPVFNIPTIVGRLFNGNNFAPMEGISVELYQDGKLVAMKDRNWQNPYKMVINTAGTFTFWSKPVPAESPGIHESFEYAIKIEAKDFEDLNHFFKIPVISEIQTAGSFSLSRTFKLPDLYLFPPGEDEDG
jgi:competence protein ComFB